MELYNNLLNISIANNKKENIEWILTTIEKTLLRNSINYNLEALNNVKKSLNDVLLYIFKNYVESYININIYTEYLNKNEHLKIQIKFICSNKEIKLDDIPSIQRKVSNFRCSSKELSNNYKITIEYVNKL